MDFCKCIIFVEINVSMKAWQVKSVPRFFPLSKDAPKINNSQFKPEKIISELGNFFFPNGRQQLDKYANILFIYISQLIYLQLNKIDVNYNSIYTLAQTAKKLLMLTCIYINPMNFVSHILKMHVYIYYKKFESTSTDL